MKWSPPSPAGALHPLLFCAGMYAVILVAAVFICSSLFYSCSAEGKMVKAGSHTASQQVAGIAAR
jgi:hypothetical protein